MINISIKSKRAFSTVVLLLFPTGSSLAGIIGSKHDFSAETWSNGEFCVICHTPHDSYLTEVPLWNHETSTAIYTLYSSYTLSEIPEQPGPGSVSRACLSCHDGTIAIDSFNKSVGTTNINDVNPNAFLDTNLSDDHPIGIKWTHQEPPGVCGHCHSFSPLVRFYFRGGSLYVECSSCHDVHNNVTNLKLLRVSMSGSQLCLVCHGMT